MWRMDMFEKATKKVIEVGDSIVNSARQVSGTIYNTTKEQGEIASLNVQKSVIEKRIQSQYAEIGKRYVEYVRSCTEDVSPFDVNDILETMEEDLSKIEEINAKIEEKQIQIKAAKDEKERQKAKELFQEEKAKLEKALQMDIISQAEYNYRLGKAEKKLENYDVLRKIEMQLEIGIITKEEYEEKVKNILD